MFAGIFADQLVNMANGFEGGRKHLLFFVENAVGGQPVLKV